MQCCLAVVETSCERTAVMDASIGLVVIDFAVLVTNGLELSLEF